MKVTLTKSEPVPTTAGATALWYLQVTAVSTDITAPSPSCIFVYRRGTDGQGDTCAAVASASQMYDMPADPGQAQPFYRTDVAEFLCRSHTELAEVWSKLQSDVRLLLNDLKRIGGSSVSTTAVIEV